MNKLASIVDTGVFRSCNCNKRRTVYKFPKGMAEHAERQNKKGRIFFFFFQISRPHPFNLTKAMHQSKISRFFTPKKRATEDESNTKSVTSPTSSSTCSSKLAEFIFDPESTSEDCVPSSKQKKRKSKGIISAPESKKVKPQLTAMESQILDLLSENSDKILLIQNGYKYRAYGEGGRTVANILNMCFIEDKKDLRFGRCSFPEVNLHKHLQRLLNHGLTIGIVKQLESAALKEFDETKKSSSIMERGLTAVYTKSTYFGDECVKDSTSEDYFDGGKYIICLNEILTKEFALVAVRPSTGEIIYDQFMDSGFRYELETRLLYLPPDEVIVISKSENILTMKILKSIDDNLKTTRVNIPEDTLESWKHILGDDALELYSVNYSLPLQQCFVSLLEYLSRLNVANMLSIHDNVTLFNDSKKHMVIPAEAIKSLELFTNTTTNSSIGSLVNILDRTRTRFGYRLFQKWISHPLIEIKAIEERHEAINALSEHNILFESMERFLGALKNNDLESMLMKLHYSADGTTPNRINRKEVYAILNHFDDLFKLVNKFEKTIRSKDFGSSIVNKIFDELLSFTNTIEDSLSLIDPSFLDAVDHSQIVQRFFKRGSFEAIEEQYAKLKELDIQFEDELNRIRTELNNPSLRYILVSKEDHLIEVRKSKEKDLSDNYIKINSTNTVGRYRSKEVVKLRKLMKYHEVKLFQRCDEEFRRFIADLDVRYVSLMKSVKNLATLDALLSLRDASRDGGYVQPKLVNDLSIKVQNARNPIIENLRSNYIANNIDIDENSRVSIITGPNMGGKSSYVKTVALLTIMAQVGCFLPCDYAVMGIFDSIFIRMGASDDILQNKSTFMVEMLECKNIILNLGDRSLVILDEIGRGTGTTDGISLAYSILKYLIECELKPVLFFITHFPSISVLENEHPQEVANFHMGYEEVYNDDESEGIPEIIFLYNLCRGVVNNLYGLNVAKLAGVPKELILKASVISEKLKADIELKDHWKFAQMVKKFLKNELDIDSLLKYLT